MSVLVVIGLNHKTAPIDLLERLAVTSEHLPKALASLTAREHVREAVVLSTCNRVEVYAHVSRYHAGMGDLRAFLSEFNGVAVEDFADRTYDYFDDRAAAHLFAVAAGLDSMVVGERQIHLQAKQAFQAAQAEGATGRMLQTLFRGALRVGKRARAETAISEGAASMVDVGLDAARQVVGDLAGRTVLVVGAGKMGGMAARRLAEEAGEILVVNRTADRARALAERVGGAELRMTELAEGLAAADLVLCSTGAAETVIDGDVLAAAVARREGRPLAIVDLAVPRDVAADCEQVPGVTVLDIDAIWARAAHGPAREAVTEARGLVEEEAAAFAAWTRTMRVEPTIAALRTRAEEVRRSEVTRVLGGEAGERAGLDERQRNLLDTLTRGIVNTLLHEPTVRLKQLADARDGEEHAAVLRELFDLPESAPEREREGESDR